MIWKSIAFVLLTIICWGIYGPVIHRGQAAMNDGRWRPFLCVGLAYFAIAVVVPVVLMQAGAEPKATHGFSFSGVVWSSAGGAAGAIGALGIILAFNFGAKPSWVMPLVFGCAPVVNAFLTIYWAGTWKEISPFFLAGLILVAMGAVMVMMFKPSPAKPHSAPAVATAGVDVSGVEGSATASASAYPPHSTATSTDSHSSPADESAAQNDGHASDSASPDAGSPDNKSETDRPASG